MKVKVLDRGEEEWSRVEHPRGSGGLGSGGGEGCGVGEEIWGGGVGEVVPHHAYWMRTCQILKCGDQKMTHNGLAVCTFYSAKIHCHKYPRVTVKLTRNMELTHP